MWNQYNLHVKTTYDKYDSSSEEKSSMSNNEYNETTNQTNIDVVHKGIRHGTHNS